MGGGNGRDDTIVTKIGIVGCAGRMGQILIREVLDTEGAELAGGVERPESPAVGHDLGALIGQSACGLTVGDDPHTLFTLSDVVIDFTAPVASLAHAAIAASTGKGHVIGTTGLTAEQERQLRAAARQAPIVHAANMSIGINLLLSMVEKVAHTLNAGYDIEIVEMHHRHKVDAPSGTALALGRAAAAGRGVALEDVWQKERDGLVGARPSGQIGFATLRGGDVVGDHTVIFAADGERLELTHKASSRQVFAKGAVRAALWLAGRPAGLYSMHDVLS